MLLFCPLEQTVCGEEKGSSSSFVVGECKRSEEQAGVCVCVCASDLVSLCCFSGFDWLTVTEGGVPALVRW